MRIREKWSILLVVAVAVSIVGIAVGLELSGWNYSCPLCPISNQNNVYESLVLVSHNLYSPTNMTLMLKNSRSYSWQVAGYYAKDSGGNEYVKSNWAGPAGSPGGVVTVFVTIGTSCGNCTYQGSTAAFNQFNAGSTYTVNILTYRNNLFSFSFIA